MKLVSLQQGTPLWAAHRAQHHNASDAAAALGASPFKSRAQLVREVATGVVAEIDDATQRRFDDGHRFEALARPIAEDLIGEELFPCVGVDGKFSASFDGLTMAFDTGFEHKTLNDELRQAIKACVTGNELPEHYRIQMEHQCMVSKAGRVLFMASKWDGETLVEELHCWYYPDPELRARIVAGWAQFEADVAVYVPGAPEAPAAAGKAPDRLPSLSVRVTGMVTESNLAEFKEVALTAIRSVNRDLRTDEDFADAELSVKWCTDVESRLQSARDAILAQTGSIDEVLRTMTDIGEEARRVRLDLEKLVKARKEAIKGEIVAAGRESVITHYANINATLGAHAIQMPPTVPTDLAAAIKGLRTLSSLRNAVDTAVANMKIAASQRADQVRAAVAVFEDEVWTFTTLFPDRVQLCATKAPEDLRNLMKARIGEHQRKLEAERERIRAQEQERADREARERVVREQREAKEASRAEEARAAAAATIEAPPPSAPATQATTGAAPTPVTKIATPASAPAPTAARINLSAINAAIAPLSITADGLASIGFEAVATERASKLYRASDLPRICRCLADRLASAAMKQAA